MEPRLSVEQAIGAAIFVLLIFVGLSSMLLPSEIEDMEREEEFYCEMVQLFKDSKGENGWPNYKNADCEADI
jgi:hypothetical protein